MQSRPRSSSIALEPPPRRSLDDPGAHELEYSENEDDHFSDASEGRLASKRLSPTLAAKKPGIAESLPKTSDARNSDDPYGLRAVDDSLEGGSSTAAPGDDSQEHPKSHERRSSRDASVPLTVVEKVDPFAASYGEVPGTLAYDMRQADAAPDVVVASEDPAVPEVPHESAARKLPVPITKLSQVEDLHDQHDAASHKAAGKHEQDAEPDIVVTEEDPEEDVSTQSNSAEETSGPSVSRHEADDMSDFGAATHNDFDDFAEGEAAEEDDFGEFDNGLADEAVAHSVGVEDSMPSDHVQHRSEMDFPILDYSAFSGRDEVIAATSKVVNGIFPSCLGAGPLSGDTVPEGDSVFLTERSLSLWSQLVTAPPLQAPNWVRSRIRRLFLVSLGVPVDLDEILPASKQNKLVLPSLQRSTSANGAVPTSGADAPPGAATRQDQNHGDSRSSTLAAPSSLARRRPGSPPSPELDSANMRILCGTTDAALVNFSTDELQRHVLTLEEMVDRARKALEYWLQKKDGARGDKEAFEGVIENLVKHARRVRK
ncbi:MAG: hypothetical protein M1826_007774 [Phylliscum demangeonii]|nr:MAG: hypothetical protein M1826_007774 [Phylliscum demangeonii]